MTKIILFDNKDASTQTNCSTWTTDGSVMFSSYYKSHLTSTDLISIDLISSELNSYEATQFGVAATNHNTHSSDETRSVEMRSHSVT